MYLLYDEFSDRITYGGFKKIYNNLSWLHIQPHVECYPYNAEYSLQFVSSKISCDEVIALRKQYNNKVFWRDAYTDYYKEKYPDELTFWNIYVGNRLKYVMLEVFTKENKYYQASISHSGSNNGRAKLTENDVRKMRKEYKEKIRTRKQIQKEYANIVTSYTINRILANDSWKNIT